MNQEQEKKCQKKCKLSSLNICTGCGRTIEEIKNAYEKNVNSESAVNADISVS